jgi:hypothetical protein
MFDVIIKNEYFGSLLIFAGVSWAMMSVIINMINIKYPAKAKNISTVKMDGRYSEVDSLKEAAQRLVSEYMISHFVPFMGVAMFFLVGALVDLLYMILGWDFLGKFACGLIFSTTLAAIVVFLMIIRAFYQGLYAPSKALARFSRTC